MGKKSREKRKAVKSLLRGWNVSENELGELRFKMTKAEARRRLLARRQAEDEILQTLCKQAMADLVRAEDERMFGELEQYARYLERVVGIEPTTFTLGT